MSEETGSVRLLEKMRQICTLYISSPCFNHRAETHIHEPATKWLRGRDKSVSDRKQQQVLVLSSEREFINVSYIYETNRYTRVNRAWRRRQTPRHVYLIRFQNGSFHMWCLRTLDKVSPNRDTVTGNEACLSKGFARVQVTRHFKRTAFSLQFVTIWSILLSVCSLTDYSVLYLRSHFWYQLSIQKQRAVAGKRGFDVPENWKGTLLCCQTTKKDLQGLATISRQSRIRWPRWDLLVWRLLTRRAPRLTCWLKCHRGALKTGIKVG